MPERASAFCGTLRPGRIQLPSAQSAEPFERGVQSRVFLGRHREYRVRHADLVQIADLKPHPPDADLSMPGQGGTGPARPERRGRMRSPPRRRQRQIIGKKGAMKNDGTISDRMLGE